MKRGSSGLSLLIAVNKPSGMTSHDVVNRCRRIFGEKRVGHTGTLDPLATGVLPICVGPATRLGTYLTSHDKRYRTTIGFGLEMDTDDIEGEPIAYGQIVPDLYDGAFAQPYIAGLVGERLQVPPRYSAIKKDGKKAYELARKGIDVHLEARPIEVYESSLVDRYFDEGQLRWVIDFSVSKGTYIRSLARDIGRELGCYAYVVSLERRESGAITLDECVSIESLENLGTEAAIDPVRVLGYRIAFADDKAKLVENGSRIDIPRELYEVDPLSRQYEICACTGTLTSSHEEPKDDEPISVVVANRLKGIYRVDTTAEVLKPECVFSTGVFRG